MNNKTKYLSLLSLVVMIFLFSGCAQKRTLYYWGDYQNNLYQYYQPDKSSITEQISSLESIIEKAKSANQSVAPGLHAHLGMLYANVGEKAKALEQFNIEKALFPESERFIQFIQNKYNGKGKNNE